MAKENSYLSDKREAVFELVKNMNKAEKRNFKLFATRLGGNEDAKFVALFDCLSAMDEYDEGRVLQRCPIKKGQLPNMKAHLYRQILISLRLLDVNHSIHLQLKEQIDFARILYNKGLYSQAGKILDKAAAQATAYEQDASMLDIVDLRKQIEVLTIPNDMSLVAQSVSRQSEQLCDRIVTIDSLSRLAIRIYSLHQKIGYARSQKDLDLLNDYFKPKLDAYQNRHLSFTEQYYLCQAMVWYRFIRHEFGLSYRHSCQWLELFNSNPEMKTVMYDSYLRGYARILDGVYLMRRYDLFVATLSALEREGEVVGSLNENAVMIWQQIQFIGRLNRSLMEGTFKEGLWITRNIDSYLKNYSKYLTVHERMEIHYKIALLYFGDGNYARCMEYLGYIIGVRNPEVRRDLQCYARMLNLIASYEAGIDSNLDYQIRSVFMFIVKMKDMGQVNREILLFLKKLNVVGAMGIKDELSNLYERLLPYENHPYERRIFYYVDIISWLESKITARPYGTIVRDKFERRQKQLKERKSKNRQQA